MKYALHCAHCGKPALLTNQLPAPATPLATHWHTLTGAQVKKGTRLECPSCSAQLIPGPAYIKAHHRS